MLWLCHFSACARQTSRSVCLMDQYSLVTTYFSDWIDAYKRSVVRPVTLRKYETSLKRLGEIAPALTIASLDRRAYQGILNIYALTHERQTTLDFHHQLRAAILDAIDDGLLAHDPTRRAVATGVVHEQRAVKFLSLGQLEKLLAVLNLTGGPSWDHFIYIVAKTGLRFAEALGVTPADVSLEESTVMVSKTWDYKSATPRFAPTKNRSSIRRIKLDHSTANVIGVLMDGLPTAQAIFVTPGHRVFNEVVNNRLRHLCTLAGVPQITVHGLRHTHASILLFAGVSVASVARRLGHANMTTTQRTYLHVIEELEAQDDEKATRCLEALG